MRRRKGIAGRRSHCGHRALACLRQMRDHALGFQLGMERRRMKTLSAARIGFCIAAMQGNAEGIGL